jgi:hypothetical protein
MESITGRMSGSSESSSKVKSKMNIVFRGLFQLCQICGILLPTDTPGRTFDLKPIPLPQLSSNHDIIHQAATNNQELLKNAGRSDLFYPIFLFNGIDTMRLLKFDSRGDLTLTKNFDENIPCYSGLPQTWGADDDELTFNDLQNGSGKIKAGYHKIVFCGNKLEGMAFNISG